MFACIRAGPAWRGSQARLCGVEPVWLEAAAVSGWCAAGPLYQTRAPGAPWPAHHLAAASVWEWWVCLPASAFMCMGVSFAVAFRSRLLRVVLSWRLVHVAALQLLHPTGSSHRIITVHIHAHSGYRLVGTAVQ
jgi:hypothetical protein